MCRRVNLAVVHSVCFLFASLYHCTSIFGTIFPSKSTQRAGNVLRMLICQTNLLLCIFFLTHSTDHICVIVLDGNYKVLSFVCWRVCGNESIRLKMSGDDAHHFVSVVLLSRVITTWRMDDGTEHFMQKSSEISRFYYREKNKHSFFLFALKSYFVYK